MVEPSLSGPEIILRSDELPKSCLFCSDIPVATFLKTDGISVHANHYVRNHKFQIVADYKLIINGSPVQFIELDKNGQRSEQAKKTLAARGLMPKRGE